MIHAFDTPYQGLIRPSPSEDDAEEWRGELGQKATHQITKLLAAAFLLGTVAGNVLREVACDVLVVPGLRRAEEPE